MPNSARNPQKSSIVCSNAGNTKRYKDLQTAHELRSIFSGDARPPRAVLREIATTRTRLCLYTYTKSACVCVLLRKSHVHSTVENRDLVKRTVGVGRKRAPKSCARFVRVYLRGPTACYLERGGRRDGARTASAAAVVRACAWVEGQEEETGDRRHDVEPRWRGWRV